jgi:hypothetical protein
MTRPVKQPQRIAGVIAALLLTFLPCGSAEAAPLSSQFVVSHLNGAIVSLKPGYGATDTEYIAPNARLGDVIVRYRQGGEAWHRSDGGGDSVIGLASGFEVEAGHILWTVVVSNRTEAPVEVGDLAIPLPIHRGGAPRNREGTSGPRTPVILKHSFISGHGSFLYWMRSDSAGPFLTLLPIGSTSLEYWESGSAQGDRVYRVFAHSAAAGAEARERGTRWRQPHTSVVLKPRGQAGSSRAYVFKLFWTDDVEAVRRALYQEGGVDVHVVPGMTVPSDLGARFAVRSRETVQSVEAEFPRQTRVQSLGRRGDYELYEVRFARLGENRLTLRLGNGRHTHLEFFSTEPVETLIKKRGAFIARHQVRDDSKWYNGLLCDWNMDNGVRPTPDNYDRISGFRIYAVTCDDPGLSKPAFLAAKNTGFPEQGEVEALDYYLRHFVWGGLQQTPAEPYPYGVYGIPDWKTNRESADPGRNGQRHLWRVYDYPHVILTYLGMYQVARYQSQIRTALTANEYLERAFGTARAMFTVPMQIERWSPYNTGFYNELVLVDLIRELELAGRRADAEVLRGFWLRKVRAFINEERELFRSEYAFDSTGFESTHALAKWAVESARRGGAEGVSLERAQRFMEKQMAANLFCRGTIEPAYYYLGSDYRGGGGNAYVLTYMSQMGGWSVLDYGLHFARQPAPFLRLGYASYLSAWALMNTGTAESNYGYWYPGKEHDGGAGGGFEPAPFGRTWLGMPHHRGSWFYSCEIDLGFCGALRAAATVLADDPIFGRVCLGGDWRSRRGWLEIMPRDGLRRRIHARLAEGNMSVELDVDRFASTAPIALRGDLSELKFDLESDNTAPHEAFVRFAALPPGTYELQCAGRVVTRFESDAIGEQRFALPIPSGRRPVEIQLRRRK